MTGELAAVLDPSLKMGSRKRYPWVFLLAGSAGSIAVWCLVRSENRVEAVISVLGLVGDTVAFLYSQHLQVTTLFTDLFRYFNGRYDKLNGRLTSILEGDGDLPLSQNQKHVLFDYFNVCAEEYLYFRAGYDVPPILSSRSV